MNAATRTEPVRRPTRGSGGMRFTSGLLAERAACVRDVVIPYQWEALNDRIPGAERSGTVQNFKVAAGEQPGAFHGYWFQDSDLAKWIEAASYRLQTHPDERLEAELDALIATIGRAQRPDGYLDTYIQLVEPGKRWANLHEYHEMYVAGHFIEAGVAHFEATGKKNLLGIVCRLADLLDRTFGPGEGKIRGYCGHEEIELALLKLGRATGEQRYVDLATYFVNERGAAPNYFEAEIARLGLKELPPYFYHDRWAYLQAHQPVREQLEPVGHAVRAMYLYTAMAGLARENDDASLALACRRLWHEVVSRHLYVTGGVGAEWMGEKFAEPYDLPNDRAYSETCAAIGLVFFARRMLDLELNGEFADVMERALYNNVLAGMAQDGTRFFYVNPLEVTPSLARRRYDCRQVKTSRVPWFGCACCPPNIARLLASIERYAVDVQPDAIALHLYNPGVIDAVIGGVAVSLEVETDYPWNGAVRIRFAMARSTKLALRLRVPGWCADASLKINGTSLPLEALRAGYLHLEREWHDTDVVELDFPMHAVRVRAHPFVAHAAGSVAIQRGPIVFCAEEIDHGPRLACLTLPAGSTLSSSFDEKLGAVVVQARGLREVPVEKSLYTTVAPKSEPTGLRLVPYFRWNNRGEGEMRVWLRES